MEKKFNEEAYRNGSEVVCDVCGSVIEHINVKTRVIARQAEGFNVTEQYFTCQECGKKYTVLIVDHGNAVPDSETAAGRTTDQIA